MKSMKKSPTVVAESNFYFHKKGIGHATLIKKSLVFFMFQNIPSVRDNLLFCS